MSHLPRSGAPHLASSGSLRRRITAGFILSNIDLPEALPPATPWPLSCCSCPDRAELHVPDRPPARLAAPLRRPRRRARGFHAWGGGPTGLRPAGGVRGWLSGRADPVGPLGAVGA